jgi:hypothetical protein
MALLALGACKDKEDKSEAPTAAKSGESASTDSAKKAAAGPLQIEKFGLSIDVPAGTKLSAMGDSQMLQGPDLVLTVDLAGEFSAATLAEEVENADMYSPKNLVKAEVEGGWDVTFENTGSMGTNYWVKSRRTIDGKNYDCSTTAHTAKQQANALAACKSLRK